jgi:hypothetical protein
VAKAKSEGINFGKASAMSAAPKIDIDGIIEDIGMIRGIGTTKLQFIREILQKRQEG